MRRATIRTKPWSGRRFAAVEQVTETVGVEKFTLRVRDAAPRRDQVGTQAQGASQGLSVTPARHLAVVATAQHLGHPPTHSSAGRV